MQKDVMFGLQQGTSVLKQINAEMGGLERIEKLMGESEDARAYQREVSEMLGGSMSNQDEDEVEDELEAMAMEVTGIREPEEEPVRLPNVPRTQLGVREERESQLVRQKERARARAQAQPSTQAAEPMLA